MFRKKFQFLHSDKHVGCGCATVRLINKTALLSQTDRKAAFKEAGLKQDKKSKVVNVMKTKSGDVKDDDR